MVKNSEDGNRNKFYHQDAKCGILKNDKLNYYMEGNRRNKSNTKNLLAKEYTYKIISLFL